MPNYVKFRRGTPSAYKNLLDLGRIEQDTLYFLYQEDGSTEATLYLGTKLIGGGFDSGGGASSLSDLMDVLLQEELADKSILIYDSTQSKWVDILLTDVVPTMVGATSSSSGVGGLVPPPPQLNENGELQFLASNGSWVSVNTEEGNSHQIISFENDTLLLPEDAINEATIGLELFKNDILIIKDPISADKWQHTSYVYNGANWVAMDGNYNAENVYFDEDLITTFAIGNISLTNGQGKIAAAGKNLKEVFNTIFLKEKNPSTTQPSVSFTSVTSGGYEVGTTVTPSYNASFNAGSYSYGPATGVTVTSWEVTSTDGDSSNAKSDTFASFVVTDDTNYTITAKANHSAGIIPVTNVGNDYEAGAITTGSKSKTSNAIYGYRNTFYGTAETKDVLDSDKIRALTASGLALANGAQFEITIPLNAVRVIIAYPANLRDVTSILDVNGMNAEIVSGFTKQTVAVEGKDNYDAIDYKVYMMDYANPNDKENTYKVQI